MRERALLIISLITAILGILLLFFISNIREEQVNISKLDLETQKDTYISGEITKVSETNKTFFLEISQNNKSISVLVFKDGNMTFTKGSFVKVKGELQEYQGSIEIVADYVTLV